MKPKKKTRKPKAGVKSKAKAKTSKKILSESRLLRSQGGTGRLGLYGGAFNPIHVGHLNAALTVREKLKLDQVILIPALNAPHREITGASGLARAQMVKSAIEPYRPELDVDDIELKRGGVSYTVDTLRAYNKKYRARNLYFIMGADAFKDFTKWKEFGELVKLANFVVTTRPGTEASLDDDNLPPDLSALVKSRNEKELKLSTGLSVILVELEDIDVSASEIRKRLRSGGNVQNMTPPSVLGLIEENGHYRRTRPLIENYRGFSFFCSRLALDRKALALKIYDMTQHHTYTDYSVICSATSTRHASSIANYLVDTAKEEFGLTPVSFEGSAQGLWVLIDFGSVVIHIFEDAVRSHYKIEGLWRDCPQIQGELEESGKSGLSIDRGELQKEPSHR